MTKVATQGQRSRSNSKNVPKSKKSAISWMLFHLQNSYLVLRYNAIMCILSDDGFDPRSRSNFPKIGKKLKNWTYLGCYFTYRLQTWYQVSDEQGQGQGKKLPKKG